MESEETSPVIELASLNHTTVPPAPYVTTLNTGPSQTIAEPYNTLTLGPLTRNDLKLLLTCEASNNNLTIPTSVVVMVDMNCEYHFCGYSKFYCSFKASEKGKCHFLRPPLLFYVFFFKISFLFSQLFYLFFNLFNFMNRIINYALNIQTKFRLLKMASFRCIYI